MVVVDPGTVVVVLGGLVVVVVGVSGGMGMVVDFGVLSVDGSVPVRNSRNRGNTKMHKRDSIGAEQKLCMRQQPQA